MRFVAIIAALVVLFSVAGCGKKVSDMVADKVAEEVVENAMAKDGQKADVKIDSNSGSVSIKTDDGETSMTSDGDNFSMKSQDGASVAIGKDAKVPEGFPQDVPIYGGLEISMASADPANKAYSLQGTTADTMDKVGAFYQQEMKSKGWTEAQAVTQSGQDAMQMFSFEKADATAMIMINADNGKTMLNITTGMQ